MNWKQPKVYAVQHEDESIRQASRSGGIFTALSDWILENNGVIYGCVLDDNFNAIHIRANNVEERNRMRGSKYIQSELGNTYKNVKKDLIEKRMVLFSGTSCQIAGLQKYLGKKYNNLFCVDVVCHGVPSPKVWKNYLKWNEKRYKSKISAVDFRNKKDYGWRDHVETLIFENGKIENSRIFTTLFFDHCILRPCCYECPYKSVMHPGDITIADYWGIEKAAPEFDDNKGVSLVLINNEFGEKIFEEVKEKLKWKQTRMEDSMQPSLKESVHKPDTREKFWNDFSRKKFDYIAKRYGGIGMEHKIVKVIKKIKRKLVG